MLVRATYDLHRQGPSARKVNDPREVADALASVLRGKTKAGQEPVEDVSSDEGAADSDDVDSDDVAEFIDVDSDESGIDDHQDFIKL